jgi:hypothetical protein
MQMHIFAIIQENTGNLKPIPVLQFLNEHCHSSHLKLGPILKAFLNLSQENDDLPCVRENQCYIIFGQIKLKQQVVLIHGVQVILTPS